jgi:hypothetical protein
MSGHGTLGRKRFVLALANYRAGGCNYQPLAKWGAGRRDNNRQH